MKAIFKMILIKLLRFFMKILYIFPIKNNRIVMNAYRGGQYACNPKYITEYLLEKYPYKYEIIWAFNEPDKYGYLKEKGIKLVKFRSFKRFYYEATAKISINNIGSYSWFPVRKDQEHINTWHGGFGVKKCGLDEIANNELMKKTIQMSSNETTLILSTSQEYDTDIIGKDLGFKGEVLRCGYPRNDILFMQKKGLTDLRKKVSSKLGLDEKSYIVLYAPTWRYQTTKRLSAINYKELIDELTRKTGMQVTVITRMHHLMKVNMGDDKLTIDATSYPDIQELLAVADCMITDYSTCVWDFSIMAKPIFLYTPDIEEYERERGSHISVFEWGFPVCRNNKELILAIREESNEEGRINAENFQKRYGSYEKGEACKQVADWVYKKCFIR